MKKQSGFKTKGMNRDLSVSAFNSEFSFENINLRLNSTDSNNLLSWVNEKGTASITVYNEVNGALPAVGSRTELSIPGIAIGTAVLNKYLVLFVTQPGTGGSLSTDSIYRLQYADAAKTIMMGVKLYSGHLNFNSLHPIETLVSYESDFVQKVYWTDGLNQPRIINIMMDAVTYNTSAVDSRFDFVRELQLNEEVEVQKIIGGNGVFSPGVIQYAFTYYDKYGQESNIFYTTPLYYVSYKDRGASPEDRVENAFKITVKHLDLNFDYLRIYSIQRTSINGTPLCKRVQDIALKDTPMISGVSSDRYTTFIDTGVNGNSIDPTELLYKGGESVSVQTMEQKDNTLFMGNISLERPYIEADSVTGILNGIKYYYNSQTYPGLTTGKRIFFPSPVSKGSNTYIYYNQLSSFKPKVVNNTTVASDISVPCSGFKYGNYYRLGVQFQYKNGKWSNPIIVKKSFYDNGVTFDWYQNQVPVDHGSSGYVEVPVFKGVFQNEDNIINSLLSRGYRKIRPVVVFPSVYDRRVTCQGVACSTLYTTKHRTTDNNLYAQSSWFFRTNNNSSSSDDTSANSAGAVCPTANGTLAYTSQYITDDSNNPPAYTAYDPSNIRQVEVWGDYNPENKFQIDQDFITLHSPDIVFENVIAVSDFENAHFEYMGRVEINRTFSDIEIQTETPTISNGGGGFDHKSFIQPYMHGIVSGLFYDDYCVEDGEDVVTGNHPFRKYKDEKSAYKWIINPWHRDGSLNNDAKRPEGFGVQTAILKKKVISNLRFATTHYTTSYVSEGRAGYAFVTNESPQIYSGEEPHIIKLSNKIYQGNINVALIPDNADGLYFAHNSTDAEAKASTTFTSTSWWKTFNKDPDSTNNNGLYYHSASGSTHSWTRDGDTGGNIGNEYLDTVIMRDLVRMKYKTTSHLVCNPLKVLSDPSSSSSAQKTIWELTSGNSNNVYNSLPVIDIIKTVDLSTIYGGTSKDAQMENNWIPCGEPVVLTQTGVALEWSYGDTYFQRYDCLKTYPFTQDDTNQIVEIGSFMLETYVNIDGRYDRNRGQINNLNMSPKNFNLFNPVYSQTDNFFTYKIMDDDYYKETSYANQIVWSKTKESGADVDQWTNVTLASAMELDGDKGSVNKLVRLNDQLIAFQDTGISQILYNENTQISTTNGVPIEIANSGKVQGKRYLSGTIGCSNKWSVTTTPSGIYFIDNNDKSIFLFNGQFSNLSVKGGFNSWSKNNLPSPEHKWYINWQSSAASPKLADFENFITYYDKQNQDVLFINSGKALAFSEHIDAFSSFYDYCNVPFFNNLSDTGVWTNIVSNSGDAAVKLYKHQAGYYCDFFGVSKPYSMTLVGNPEPLLDKTFSNLEFRAIVGGEGAYDSGTSLYEPYIPFDNLDVWNEYQHGVASLSIMNGHASMVHHKLDNNASLKRKYRIWRCDIPRDNAPLSSDASLPTEVTRFKLNPLHRIRNPWAYLKLSKNAAVSGSLPKVEIHDAVLTYHV